MPSASAASMIMNGVSREDVGMVQSVGSQLVVLDLTVPLDENECASIPVNGGINEEDSFSNGYFRF